MATFVRHLKNPYYDLESTKSNGAILKKHQKMRLKPRAPKSLAILKSCTVHFEKHPFYKRYPR